MKVLVSSLLLCLSALAQTRTTASKPSLDKPKLEAYLRYLELWVPDVNVKIDDPQPMAGAPGSMYQGNTAALVTSLDVA